MAQPSTHQSMSVKTRPTLAKRPMPPVLRGFLWGGIGYLLGVAIMFYVDRWPQHYPPIFNEPAITVGWILALVGWLAGVGGYEALVLPWLGQPYAYHESKTWCRYFALSLDNKVVGIQYLVGSIASFGIAGLAAMGIRAQLMGYNNHVFPTDVSYFTAVTIHGVLMLLGVAVVGFIGGFGNYFLL